MTAPAQHRRRTTPVATAGERCPLRICRERLLIDIDRLGRTVITCPSCAKRRAGICRHCSRPVVGTVGRATYCAEHKVLVRQAQQRASEARHKEARLARSREREKRPEVRARRAVLKREWASRHPDRVKQYKRTYLLRRTEGYVAGYMRWNANPVRAEQKRAQARQRYYELHPTRPAPVCVKCGAAIPYTGNGRPRTTCGSRNYCPTADGPRDA